MPDLKCQFDGNGWLQGPIRITHVMTPNRYNSGFGTGRGVVMHTEDGYETGTVETFMNPASQVSAFFSIGQDGSCHQYLPVGHGYCAWSQGAGNELWRGIEDEDRTDPSIPFTQAQLTTFAQILEACSAYDGFPLQITDSPAGSGLILHSDGGSAWGGHTSCPGSVRAAQRPAIIALARQIRAAPTPDSNWTEAMINNLPVLQQGDSDKPGQVCYVHRMQALLAVVGQVTGVTAAASLKTDGTFGPTTQAAVVAIQDHFGIPGGGGECGQRTWKALITGSWQ